MVNRLVAFDQWLIGKFETFAHWFQRWTGKTNYFLARITFANAIALVGFFAWMRGGFFLPIVFGFCGLLWMHLLSRDEEMAYRRMEKGVANPEKYEWCGVRMVAVGVALFLFFLFLYAFLLLRGQFSQPESIGIFSGYGGLLFYPISLYFSACDPLPPGTSKIRAWFESLFLKPAAVSSRA